MSDQINIIPSDKPFNNSGSQFQASPKAPQTQANVTPENSGLHIGEIVVGTVIEKISSNSVSITLPNGNYNAVINGSLEKGDSLFFKIQEVQPTLVLKIHEVLTKNKNGDIPIENLLRILDLPSDNIYKILIENLKKLKNSLNRDQINNIVSAYRTISEIQKKSKSLENIIRVLVEMDEAGFPLKPNLFDKLLPLFNDENQIKDSVTELNKLKSTLPYNIQKTLNTYYELIFSKNPDFEKLIQFFSIESKDNEQSFFETLILITKIEDKNNLNMVKARAYAKSLLSTIEAMHLWNAFALHNNAGLHLIFPVVFSELLSVVRINVLKIDESETDKLTPINFVFKTNTNSLGETTSDVTANQKLIDLTFFSQDQKDIEVLSKYKNELLNTLSKNHYIIKSVKFGLASQINQINSNTTHNIKVVI
jgi:hypothetical protein